MEVVVLDYGAGNVRSVVFALERLGISARLSNDPQVISNADYIIFPGQGAAAMAMNKLNLSGLTAVLPNLKQPILGICLGMQLLFENTEEGNTRGLASSKAPSKSLNRAKIPQMGWNSLQNIRGPLFDSINENTHMYLVHSYYAPVVPETLATTTYGTTSVYVQKDNFYGVQFHPEKSSQAGQQLLQNFLQIKQ